MIHSQQIQKTITVVLDVGSQNTHVGFAGDEVPKISAPSYQAFDTSLKPHATKTMAGSQILKDDRTELEIQHIFESCGKEGYQYNFDKYLNFVETLLAQHLKLGQSSLSILITEDAAAQPHEIEKQRKKLGEFMFQQLNIHNITFMKKPTLASFSIGRPTALVVDSGHNFSRASLVHDGYCLYSSSVPYGGSSINSVIKQRIQTKIQKQFTIPLEYGGQAYKEGYIRYHKNEELNKIKDMFTIEEEIEMVNEVDYKLPDGQQIKLNRNQINDPFDNFPLFWKKYAHSGESQFGYHFIKYPGYRSLASLTTDVLQRSQSEGLGKQVCENILLIGGNMKFSNISQNLKQKMRSLQPDSKFCKGGKKETIHSWVGGSIVGEMSAFNNFWISQGEWKEGGGRGNNGSTGLSIINKKCQ